MSRFAGRTGPIALGMVGGGRGAFIGAVHRMAARLDGAFSLTAGAFSSDPERAWLSAAALGVAPDRAYGDFETMARREARLKDGVEAVAIVTPNHLHLAAARAFLRRGVHVICDKPLTGTPADARRLAAAASASGALFILTHNYTGYPMVRQARAMVRDGAIGAVRVVQVEYAQDWLARPHDPANRQAAWRTDPARSGLGGATGDIGTHAINLLRFVTGLRVEALSAELRRFVPGRALDDDAHVTMRLTGGARGALWCSQVAAGCENGLRLRVFGETGGLDWSQENPNLLWHTPLGGPARRLTRAGPGTVAAARLPPGHPEGFIEAFGTLYSEAAAAIRAHREGTLAPEAALLPGVADGVEGVAFVAACVRSSRRNGAWVTPS